MKRVAQFKALCHARRALAPNTPFFVYVARSLTHAWKLRTKRYSVTARGESAGNGCADPVGMMDAERERFSYRGLEQVRAWMATGLPLSFVAWHHGALRDMNLGISLVLPEVALFDRHGGKTGTVSSHSMLKARGLSLLMMDRFLRQGRSIFWYLDGVPLGETIQVSMAGMPANVSLGPIRVVRSVEGTGIVPVTAYYGRANSVTVIFHPPRSLPAPASASDVLHDLVRVLEADLREQAPEQAMWWFLVNREREAAADRKERVLRRISRLQAPCRLHPAGKNA